MIIHSLEQSTFQRRTRWATTPTSGWRGETWRPLQPRRHPALYLSATPPTAIAEYQQDAPLMPPGTLVAYRIQRSAIGRSCPDNGELRRILREATAAIERVFSPSDSRCRHFFPRASLLLRAVPSDALALAARLSVFPEWRRGQAVTSVCPRSESP